MTIEPTPVHALDAAVEAVARRKAEWADLPVEERISLLRRCLAAYVRTADDVVAEGCKAKGIDPREPMSGEEWMSGPVPVVRQIRLFLETLDEIRQSGVPRIDARAVRRTPTGELAVTVFPRDRFDALMYLKTRSDVWMQPGVDEANLREHMAAAYRAGTPRAGKVALVLGAGNVAAIAPADVLHKLLAEHQVVVLKMHPVNAYLGPLLERAFAPLVERGFLRIVYGDVAEGQHLIHHPAVDEVHMTGSTAVHDRIVWGDTPGEQAQRRRTRTPKLAKRVTSELGCVTPVVVVPGRWSDAELQYQAENVATMVAHSASCTCTSAKVLVTWRGWPQRQAFLDRVAAVLARQEPRRAYYPGAANRYRTFVGGYPQARRLADAAGDRLACATIYDVDSSRTGDVVFREEAWSPVLVETALDAPDAEAFLSSAVRFCNEHVFGTLSVDVILDPRARESMRDAVDRAVAGLRYGTVSINHWSAVSFGLGLAPWGAYPGHTLEDVGSGIGWVHNPLMFDRPLKSVLWGPFTVRPKPAWFTTHRRAGLVGRRMVGFEASPSAWRLLPVLGAGVRP